MKKLLILFLILLILIPGATAGVCKTYNITRICALHPIWYNMTDEVYNIMPDDCRTIKTIYLYHGRDYVIRGAIWYLYRQIAIYTIYDWRFILLHECGHNARGKSESLADDYAYEHMGYYEN